MGTSSSKVLTSEVSKRTMTPAPTINTESLQEDASFLRKPSVQRVYRHTNNQPPIAFDPNTKAGRKKLADPSYTGDFFGQRPQNTDSLFNAVFAPPPRTDSEIERTEKKRAAKKKVKKEKEWRKASLKEEQRRSNAQHGASVEGGVR